MRDADAPDTGQLGNEEAPAADAPRDPWRKHRVLAGLLTSYVGVQAAYALASYVGVALVYDMLGGALSGLGSPGARVTISGPLVLGILAVIIGGLMFTGRKGRGRTMVWLAALASIPINLFGLYLLALVPGTPSRDVPVSALLAPVVSVYLIWVLIKTSPDRRDLRTRLLALARPRNLAAATAVVGGIWLLSSLGEAADQRARDSWVPSSSLAGLRIGMARSVVRARKGSRYSSSADGDNWYVTTSRRPDFYVLYEGDVVTEIGVVRMNARLEGRGGKSTAEQLPFGTIAEMHDILGPEDVLAVSGPRPPYGSSHRQYTYAEWGVSYRFSGGRLIGVTLGPIEASYFEGGEYFVNGQQLCPGEACPWSDDGTLKPGNEDLDYPTLLSRASAQ